MYVYKTSNTRLNPPPPPTKCVQADTGAGTAGGACTGPLVRTWWPGCGWCGCEQSARRAASERALYNLSSNSEMGGMTSLRPLRLRMSSTMAIIFSSVNGSALT